MYLDHAATTPVDPAVLAEMLPYFSQKFGNPMSLHSFGQEAMKTVEKARTQIGRFLKCSKNEVIFTSGATESNNLAIKGVVQTYQPRSSASRIRPHIITTQFEHHCVLETCKYLEKNKLAEVTYLPVYKDGIVRVGDVKKAIKKNTILVSIMYVNNEIGTVQPIKEIGDFLRKTHNAKPVANDKRSTLHAPRSKILFHTDATQAVNYFDCDVKKLNVDLLSLSGHKIYGPKGVGALYIKKNTPIKKIQDGGEQEFNLRAGTHNVPGIVGLGAAIARVKSSCLASSPRYEAGRRAKFKVQSDRILKLRNYLIKKVLKEIPSSYLNGSKKLRSPNNANFRFNNVEGESLVLLLDKAGIAASTGSACSSGTLEPSHVLMALGLKHEQAHGSLRISMGKATTKKEVLFTIAKLKKIIIEIRKRSGTILTDYYEAVDKK